MRKTAYILTALLILSLVGCGAVKSADSYFPDEHFESSVLPEECFICSPSIPNWGQNNVGIISLNTFEVLPIEINRYRNGGILIEENTGTCLAFDCSGQQGAGWHRGRWWTTLRGNGHVHPA